MKRYERGRGALGDPGGAMWESLTSDGPGSLEELSSDGQVLRVGTTDPVADFFNYGTRRQRARPFFPDGELPPDLVAQVEEIVARHVLGPFAD